MTEVRSIVSGAASRENNPVPCGTRIGVGPGVEPDGQRSSAREGW
jgi:hypothetical protein